MDPENFLKECLGSRGLNELLGVIKREKQIQGSNSIISFAQKLFTLSQMKVLEKEFWGRVNILTF